MATFAWPQATAEGGLQFADLGRCQLDSGQVVEQCRVGYRTFGTLNAERSNAVLFPTWFGGTSADLRQFFGPDKLIDTTRFFGVAIDALGDGVSSSPSNNPVRKGPDFPQITIRDMVRSQYRLATETLGLRHVFAVAGLSMGGMQVFEWMVTYPDFMDKAVAMAGTPQQTSFDLLQWDLLRRAIVSDPDYAGGHYTGHPVLEIASELLAMDITSPAYHVRTETRAEMPQIIKRTVSSPFSVDPNDYLWQLRAMMAHDVTHGSGTLEDAARRTKARLFFAGDTHDHLVNPTPGLHWAKILGAPTFISTADCGHRIFVCDRDALTAAVRRFLAE